MEPQVFASMVPRSGTPTSLADANYESTIKNDAGVDGRLIKAQNLQRMLQRAYADLWSSPGGGGGQTVIHFGNLADRDGDPSTWACADAHGRPHPPASTGDYFIAIDVTDANQPNTFEFRADPLVASAPVTAAVKDSEGAYVITSFVPASSGAEPAKYFSFVPSSIPNQPPVLSLV